MSQQHTNSIILRLPAVQARTGLSRSAIYLYISQGRFPAQLALGPRASGWLSSEIDAWIAARAAERVPNNAVGIGGAK